MISDRQIRLNHIFAPDGRAAIIALDHGIAGMYPLEQLSDPARLLPLVIAGGADAVIVTPGILKTCAGLFGRTGVILRIDGGPSALTQNWNEMEVMLQVEDALRLGADAVILMGITGAEGEARSLAGLGRVAARCAGWGMPVIGEMLPGGFSAKEVSIDQIATSARLGADLGVDVVKIRYQGPAGDFRKVTASCFVPVIVLGGSRQPADKLIAEICGALEAGAKGVAIGRNVWQHPQPDEITRHIAEAVHGS